MTPALSAMPGTLLSQVWAWGPLALMAVGIPAFVVTAYWRGRPLRQEMRARPVTFTVNIDVQSFNDGICHLNVHGDMFEVSGMIPVWLFGQQWCYRAGDTTMEVVQGWRRDWIQVAVQQQAGWARWAGRRVRISPPYPPRKGFNAPNDRRGAQRWMTGQIWDALIRAGVHPVGAPPQ